LFKNGFPFHSIRFTVIKIVTIGYSHNHLKSFGIFVDKTRWLTNASRPKVDGYLFVSAGHVCLYTFPLPVWFNQKSLIIQQIVSLHPTGVNNFLCHIFQKCHFSNKASALCKFSIAVLTSSYCKALAAKRQYFCAFSLSSGDNVLLG